MNYAFIEKSNPVRQEAKDVNLLRVRNNHALAEVTRPYVENSDNIPFIAGKIRAAFEQFTVEHEIENVEISAMEKIGQMTLLNENVDWTLASNFAALWNLAVAQGVLKPDIDFATKDSGSVERDAQQYGGTTGAEVFREWVEFMQRQYSFKVSERVKRSALEFFQRTGRSLIDRRGWDQFRFYAIRNGILPATCISDHERRNLEKNDEFDKIDVSSRDGLRKWNAQTKVHTILDNVPEINRTMSNWMDRVQERTGVELTDKDAQAIMHECFVNNWDLLSQESWQAASEVLARAGKLDRRVIKDRKKFDPDTVPADMRAPGRW